MASQLAILTRTKTLIRTLTPIKSISTFACLSQEPQIASHDPPPDSDPNPTSSATPLPPNPATGSPLYSEDWRNPLKQFASTQSLTPVGFYQSPVISPHSMSQKYDLSSLLNLFADWTTSQRWSDMKEMFENWIRTLDSNGKPNRPDVNLYNHYLRANLMSGATAADLLDLVSHMEDFAILPNTASYNMVLKAMYQAQETAAAQKLLERMEEGGKESKPNDESIDLLVGMLFKAHQIDDALKYIGKALKNGHSVSQAVYLDCVRSCVNQGRLDLLLSIMEKCKSMDQNKTLSPSWLTSNQIAEMAMRENNSKLAYYALEFLAKWIAQGERARPPVLLSVDEGLVVSALATAGRTYNSTLVDASWEVLRCSLRQKKAPNPESFIAKIYAYASIGNLLKAFTTLREFEVAYGNFENGVDEELFSPFTSLYPLVVACSKKGFETLDTVYFQLENLSKAERPYKSVAALNCIILGCANIWDLDRAYQTFEAIGSSFGLTPNIHSYNALMYAFGKLKKTFEASRVLDHLVGLGVKPNKTSYLLLVEAHLINRDVKAALSVLDQMVSAGFVPPKVLLKKVRRRCVREMDYSSDDQLEVLIKRFNIQMGTEKVRDTLFNLDYSIRNFAS